MDKDRDAGIRRTVTMLVLSNISYSLLSNVRIGNKLIYEICSHICIKSTCTWTLCRPFCSRDGQSSFRLCVDCLHCFMARHPALHIVLISAKNTHTGARQTLATIMTGHMVCQAGYMQSIPQKCLSCSNSLTPAITKYTLSLGQL
jgi:hypothetical protein